MITARQNKIKACSLNGNVYLNYQHLLTGESDGIRNTRTTLTTYKIANIMTSQPNTLERDTRKDLLGDEKVDKSSYLHQIHLKNFAVIFAFY